MYRQDDFDGEEHNGTIPRTTTCSLVRDHLNFARVEALNVDGFENDSRLLSTSPVDLYYHAFMDRQQDIKDFDGYRGYTTKRISMTRELSARSLVHVSYIRATALTLKFVYDLRTSALSISL